MKQPIVYTSSHTVKFSELDPYKNMRTAVYSAYYVDHRMELGEYLGWDINTLEKLPFMIWVTRIELDFLRSVIGDQQITITSFVREFLGSDAYIECSMMDQAGNQVSRCLMIVAYIDKSTNRATD
jgi:acyl-CoA thioester hydrolase